MEFTILNIFYFAIQCGGKYAFRDHIKINSIYFVTNSSSNYISGNVLCL